MSHTIPLKPHQMNSDHITAVSFSIIFADKLGLLTEQGDNKRIQKKKGWAQFSYQQADMSSKQKDLEYIFWNAVMKAVFAQFSCFTEKSKILSEGL